jgi:hypothetical protein
MKLFNSGNTFEENTYRLRSNPSIGLLSKGHEMKKEKLKWACKCIHTFWNSLY